MRKNELDRKLSNLIRDCGGLNRQKAIEKKVDQLQSIVIEIAHLLAAMRAVVAEIK